MAVVKEYQVAPGAEVQGEVTVPGDKSISHRSLMLGGIATGETRISGFLASEDCLATLGALRALGVQIERPEPTRVIVQGAGADALRGVGRSAVRLDADRRCLADAPADGARGRPAAADGRADHDS
jgi:3-phosphoshikimate 1-carboxyvinyltransferase